MQKILMIIVLVLWALQGAEVQASGTSLLEFGK